MPIQPPSRDTLAEIAQRHGFELSDEDLHTYHQLSKRSIAFLRRLDQLTPTTPPVSYPRTSGRAPAAEENPYGAWAWRCDIDGAREGLLAGKTIAIKDSIAVAGVPMMNGSSLLEGFIPQTDATAVTRILDAGGKIIGKATCEHLCVSDSSNTADTGIVRNPRDTSRSAGGSSSGSAVLVATGVCDAALGADQAGSIRIPSSWNGIYGLKPTYGLVPYTGCCSIEYTFDHIGPMAANVGDLANLLQAIAGPDGFDPRQSPAPPDDYLAALDDGIAGMRVGILQEGFGWPGAEEEVESAVRESAAQLTKAGAKVQSISVPLHRDSDVIWRGVSLGGNLLREPRGSLLATGSSAWCDVALHDAFGRARSRNADDLAHTAKSIAMLGTYLHERYGGRVYGKARNLVPALRAAYDQALESCDILVMPSTPQRATLLPSADAGLEELIHHAFEVNASICGFNLTGHPSMSIPLDTGDGMPIGMMTVGKRHDEATMLRFARACEQTIAPRRTVI